MIIRYINLALLAIVLMLLVANFIARQRKVPRRTRRIVMWMFFFFCNAAYRIQDDINDGIRINEAVKLNTVILSGLILAMLWHPKGDDSHYPNDGSMGARLGAWLDRTVLHHKAARRRRLHRPRQATNQG